ncbi:putative Mn2+ efflux pump MntP [Dongia mobilis]|uniref:Putative manganese efflux pump MntP n=1 Tax=Dongia mobilis TaxID=578943 RepID=A0A4R6WQ94_9PROT|nr:manganese efflux pump MntP family protein [Dongia mobilis]TDQ81420.1 putative Mn2+ efflux pump MntP [Dongia mobilis]
MSIATSLALAFSLSADAFAASLGKGAALHRPRVAEAARIAAYFGIFELVAPVIGLGLGYTIGRYIEAVDHWIAFALLLGVGGRMCWLAFMGEKDADAPKPVRHGPLVLMLTAMATSIDATAVGVTLAYMDLHIPLTIMLIGIVTFGMTFGGVLIARVAGPLLGRWAECVGGLCLIAIGVKLLFEHGVFA